MIIKAVPRTTHLVTDDKGTVYIRHSSQWWEYEKSKKDVAKKKREKLEEEYQQFITPVIPRGHSLPA